MFDGLSAASALEAGCDALYSEDLQDGQVIEGRVTVRNRSCGERNVAEQRERSIGADASDRRIRHD
jgi:hypothetical protein